MDTEIDPDRQAMGAGAVFCIGPARSKAEAVRNAPEGPVTPMVPAWILPMHAVTRVCLDEVSTSLCRTRPEA